MRRPVDADRVGTVLERLARAAEGPTTVYLVGGTTAVTIGWRTTTLDIDLRLEPEDDGMMRGIPDLKVEAGVNIEFASPLDFLPELPGWRDRSSFVRQIDQVTVRQFDPYSQALAKLERGFDRDRADVQAMLDRELIEPDELVRLFDAIAPALYRFPTVDADRLRQAVRSLTTRD